MGKGSHCVGRLGQLAGKVQVGGIHFQTRLLAIEFN